MVLIASLSPKPAASASASIAAALAATGSSTPSVAAYPTAVTRSFLAAATENCAAAACPPVRRRPRTDVNHCRTDGPLDANNRPRRCNGQRSSEKPVKDDSQFNSDDRAARQHRPLWFTKRDRRLMQGLLLQRRVDS